MVADKNAKDGLFSCCYIHFAEILNFSVKVDWCLEGICKVLHENVKGLQFPKTHNNF